MRNFVLLPVVLVLLFLLALMCGPLPSDPNKDPDNAKTEFRTVNDEDPVQPVIVQKDSVVDLGLRLRLPVYIEEIAFAIESNDRSVDTVFNVSGPWKENDTIETFTLIFRKPGTKKCIVSSIRFNESKVSDTLIFDVETPDETICPEWTSDTITVSSLKNRYTTIGLRSKVEHGTGIETINLVDLLDNKKFMCTDDSLAIDTSADTGRYYAVLVVGNNDCFDTVIVQWTVNQASLMLRPDTVKVAENGTVTILPLDNDVGTDDGTHLTDVEGAHFGTVEVHGDTVLYSAGKGDSTSDILKYFIKSSNDTGFIIVTILPVDDALVARDTSVTVTEDTPLSIYLHCVGVKGSCRYNLTSAPDHGELTDDTSDTVVYLPDEDYCGPDSFSFRMYDGKMYSNEAKVQITILALNDPPAIVHNHGLLVAEGGHSIINEDHFSCSDPDNDAENITITVTGLPVNGRIEKNGEPIDSGNGFILTDFISGDIGYQHGGSETDADSIRINITDGDTAIAVTIPVTITPVNDPVLFSKTGPDMKASCGLGNNYRDTVMIIDPEKNYDKLTFSIVPATFSYLFDTESGRLVIDGNVDNRTYNVGADVSLSLRVKDGELSDTLAWNLKVGKHVWTKVAENVSTWGSIVAVDSFTIINTRCSGSFNSFVNFEIKENGDSIWTNLFSWNIPSTNCNVQLKLVNNILIATSIYNTVTYNIISRIKTEPLQHIPYLCFTGQNGSLCYVLIDTLSDTREIYHGNDGKRCFIVNGEIKDIIVSNDVTFILTNVYNNESSDYSPVLVRWSNSWWNSRNVSEDTINISTGGMANKLLTDNNNCDTMFILRDDGGFVRIPNAKNPIMSTFRVQDEMPGVENLKPICVEMVDGFTGFMISNNGQLFFTNDCFKSLTEEFLEADRRVFFVFLSADKKAIFALAFDFSENGYIFRY